MPIVNVLKKLQHLYLNNEKDSNSFLNQSLMMEHIQYFKYVIHFLSTLSIRVDIQCHISLTYLIHIQCIGLTIHIF